MWFIESPQEVCPLGGNLRLECRPRGDIRLSTINLLASKMILRIIITPYSGLKQ